MKTMSIQDVHSGDLLAWSKNKHSKISNAIIQGIGKATGSKYGHVGIAWELWDETMAGTERELFVLEAAIPSIQVARVTEDRHFYCVPMDLVWLTEYKQFLVEKIGLPYGYMDAARAGLGLVSERDDRWQCAELAHAFYEHCGILLPKQFRPGDVVKNAIAASGHDVYRVLI